jgi:hypothetical protein
MNPAGRVLIPVCIREFPYRDPDPSVLGIPRERIGRDRACPVRVWNHEIGQRGELRWSDIDVDVSTLEVVPFPAHIETGG